MRLLRVLAPVIAMLSLGMSGTVLSQPTDEDYSDTFVLKKDGKKLDQLVLGKDATSSTFSEVFSSGTQFGKIGDTSNDGFTSFTTKDGGDTIKFIVQTDRTVRIFVSSLADAETGTDTPETMAFRIFRPNNFPLADEIDIFSDVKPSIPEPSTCWLMVAGLGIAGLLGRGHIRIGRGSTLYN